METLTELQVMNYCSKLSEHFINNRDNLMNLKVLGKFHSIISPSGRLIAIGHHPMTCKSLSNLDLIFNVGLVGLSIHTIFVFGCIALTTEFGSFISVNVNCKFDPGDTIRLKNRCVPPYTSSIHIT